MIIAFVRAPMPEGLTRAQHAERSQKGAARFQGMPGLMRKNYLANFEDRVGGGVYCWETREAAEECHRPGGPWWENFTKAFGVAPEVDADLPDPSITPANRTPHLAEVPRTV